MQACAMVAEPATVRGGVAYEDSDMAPKVLAVIGLSQMSAFMGDDVISHGERRQRQTPGQAYGGRARASRGRARSPPRPCVIDG